MKSVRSLLERLGAAALDLVYPPRCVGCGSGDAIFCEECSRGLMRAAPPRCARCWRPRPAGGSCDVCQHAPPAFDRLRAAFVFEGGARELVHALKFRGMTALAPPMGSLLAEATRRHGIEAEIVVPVPLSNRGRRARGYNQAEVLSAVLARELGLPLVTAALTRRRHAAPQSRSADAEARQRNVAGAFACREDGVAGQRVLLVDDVTTTGVTLAACATALKEAGARSVWALAFARED